MDNSAFMKTKLLVLTLTLCLAGAVGVFYAQQPLAQPGADPDLNGDGCVDLGDYDILMDAVRSRASFNAQFDLNGDGRLTRADSRTMVASFDEPRGAVCVTTENETVTLSQANLVVEIPAGWVSTATDDLLVLSNVANRQPFSEETYLAESFLTLEVLAGVNRERLPVSEWFAGFFPNGGSSDIHSESIIMVGDRVSLRTEVSELGGLRAHFYIPNGSDIVYISHGLFAESFLDEYAAIINSLVFAE